MELAERLRWRTGKESRSLSAPDVPIDLTARVLTTPVMRDRSEINGDGAWCPMRRSSFCGKKY
jgi:hypothetical protein